MAKVGLVSVMVSEQVDAWLRKVSAGPGNSLARVARSAVERAEMAPMDHAPVAAGPCVLQLNLGDLRRRRFEAMAARRGLKLSDAMRLVLALLPGAPVESTPVEAPWIRELLSVRDTCFAFANAGDGRPAEIQARVAELGKAAHDLATRQV